VLAARRAGIHTVIMPKANQKDLRDLPEEVRKEMEFIFASRVEDVLRTAIPQLSERMDATKTRPINFAA
jgi:ATP-dependent Lon protease